MVINQQLISWQCKSENWLLAFEWSPNIDICGWKHWLLLICFKSLQYAWFVLIQKQSWFSPNMTGNRTASFKFEIFWSHCIFSLVCCLFQMIGHWHQGDKTGWTTCIGYWYCTLGTTTFQKLFSHYRYFIETLEKQLNLTIKTFSAHRRAFYAHNTKLAHLSKADETIASGCIFYSGVYVTSFVFHVTWIFNEALHVSVP